MRQRKRIIPDNTVRAVLRLQKAHVPARFGLQATPRLKAAGSWAGRDIVVQVQDIATGFPKGASAGRLDHQAQESIVFIVVKICTARSALGVACIHRAQHMVAEMQRRVCRAVQPERHCCLCGIWPKTRRVCDQFGHGNIRGRAQMHRKPVGPVQSARFNQLQRASGGYGLAHTCQFAKAGRIGISGLHSDPAPILKPHTHSQGACRALRDKPAIIGNHKLRRIHLGLSALSESRKCPNKKNAAGQKTAHLITSLRKSPRSSARRFRAATPRSRRCGARSARPPRF